MSTLDKDIVENAAKAGFKRLGDALKAAGLIGTYKGIGPFTFFAPTDEAFEKIPPGALRSLLENTPALADILIAHVVAGETLARDDIEASEAVGCQGWMVSIAANEAGLTVKGAKVLLDQIEASNGFIHLLDTVMM